jgi:hypothetical protein
LFARRRRGAWSKCNRREGHPDDRQERRLAINDPISALEAQLNDFDPAARIRALTALADALERGLIPCEPEAEVCNMHCHTFFSFNACGHSPTSLAWLARRRGWKLVGIVDFDVLDGVDEFLAACTVLGVRGVAGMETRVYVPEFATREINSPGEPGIAYHMGIGFPSGRVPEGVRPILAGLRARAAQRNRDMAARINAYLAPVTIDYDRDVLPLSPGGNPTERHMLVAYLRAASAQPDPAAFWAEKLCLPKQEIEALIGDTVRLQNLVRARLMKRGGVGYVQPGPESFPTVDELHRLVVACGALPCATWLDGTSAGEQAIEELLGMWLERGVAVLNIVPDRNWNIPDPDLRRLKVRKLHEVAELARALRLPIIAGTEMNSPGQKLIDDFSAPELAPLHGAFMEGAWFVYGHTVLERALGRGWGSDWARAHLPSRPERNAFYEKVGRLTPPGWRGEALLAALRADMTPAEVLARIGG